MNSKVKFYVFAGREKNIKILHVYIEVLLKENLIDEYHIFNFSRNKDDETFLKNEYERLFNLFLDKIFIHNHSFYDQKKINWSPFYKYISTTSDKNDIIIKCDDDILFIDINSFKNAIEERKKDNVSFLIHSNCINNGVCAYYQKHLFPKIEEQLNIYPIGGLLGILFENPIISAVIQYEFTNDILESTDFIKKYYIEDVYFSSRISINFIFIRGEDTKYLKDVEFDDEYQLSSFIPEKLLRPNRILGNFITCHLSYSIQNYLIEKRKDILLNYQKISKSIKVEKNITFNFQEEKYKIDIPSVIYENKDEEIFKVKNWYKKNNYYIKNIETGKYVCIDFFKDTVKLNSDSKSVFEIHFYPFENKNICNIKMGLYYLTHENCINNFKNESLLLKCFQYETEKYISVVDVENTNNQKIFHLYFLNEGLEESDKNCFSIENNKIWKFEEIPYKDEYLYVKRFIKNNKFYYEDVNSGEIFTNFYYGWGIDTIMDSH
jgi:hypothetical protein